MVTPLQMAMVAAAVANNGRLMVPHFAARRGHIPMAARSRLIRPQLYHQVMSAKTAQDVNQMMRTVVDEGTGTPGAARQRRSSSPARPAPPRSARPGEGETQPWFIGFAPADDPKVAVAVDLERSTSGQSGGAVAAPIARDVVETLLSEGK